MSAYCGLPAKLVLSLADRSLDLMDPGQGFRVAALDLGFPTVRADATDAPTRPGSIDTTALFGARAVTISGTVAASSSGSRSAGLALLTPFLDPAARPVLTYQTDPDVEARTLVVRSEGLTVPLAGPDALPWSVSFVAPDALALGIPENSAMCGPSFLVTAGRAYDLAFDRSYPGSFPNSSVAIVAAGDYPAAPIFTIVGPATAASITVTDATAPTSAVIQLQPAYTIAAGHSLVIDCAARAIVDDTGANVYGDALAGFATWPRFIPGHNTVVAFLASGIAASTLLTINWFDRWLI